MVKLYVITGPAGVGKTTVTKKLSERLGKCAVLEGDEIYHQVVGGTKPWLEGNHLDVMWKNLVDLSRNYLEAGIDVVLNYIVYRDRLEQLINSLAKFEIHFVLLMASTEVVTKRDESRDADVQVHRVSAHIEKFNKQGYGSKYFLNTDSKTIDEEIDEILSGGFLMQSAVDENHVSGLQKVYFDMVKSGEKIYELRLNDEKRQMINVGEDYVFGLEPERLQQVRKKIKNKLIFKNFNEACDKLDFKKVGFSSRDEMKIVYNTIYSKEEQEKYGVVAFEFENWLFYGVMFNITPFIFEVYTKIKSKNSDELNWSIFWKGYKKYYYILALYAWQC